MAIDLNNRVENDIRLDASSVWVLSDMKQFSYSDGIASERYLHKVFSEAQDLSSNSHELERWIKDWPSEYHLSRKRSQLLRGFDFDKSKKVLEVGCGCGAITRFLGETFDEVVSIEGSLSRAKLARLRSKDLTNVEILCAPFQEIKFKERFDIIFCIGVFEYSGSFVKADDPYDAILDYFYNILNPDGILVLAIENQFGLKYFSSSREDHTNIMFDGIEGYHHKPKSARTFGYDELKTRIGKYFGNIEYHFPYPDYKTPTCVLSEKFLSVVNAGELVGNVQSRDSLAFQKPLFDERFACMELDNNNKLPFFSNSFLIVAGKQKSNSIKTQALGVLYSTQRTRNFQTVSKFIEHADKSIWVSKTPITGEKKVDSHQLTLHATESKWRQGQSLQMLLARRVKEENITLDELFSPCRSWLSTLENVAKREGNELFLDGKYVDYLWRNAYSENGEYHFIDQEWEWHEKININVLVIRSIYWFLRDIACMSGLNTELAKGPMVPSISKIAKSIGVKINEKDFAEFYKLEAKFAEIIFDSDPIRIFFHIKLPLWNKSIYFLIIKVRNEMKKLVSYKELIVNHFLR